MDLASGKVIKYLFKKYQLRPSKRLGQNFLIDKRVLKKIISAASIKPEDIILEIGPGIGVLTQELAERAEKVIAIEKDSKMVEVLKETLKGFKNIEIIQEDVLEIKDCEVARRPQGEIGNYKVVANLPYYIVSPVIRKLLESKRPPEEMILMVQKEVAQRICAKPPRINLLAVSVQFYAWLKIISYVSKKSFWPQPKVDSAILKIVPEPQAIGERDLFFKIVKAGFSQPRKQLINNLSRLNFSSKNLSGQAKDFKASREKVRNWLLKNKIKPNQRAETLNLKDWAALTESFPR